MDRRDGDGMKKGFYLNREQYKSVKRMDHRKMEDFIFHVYSEGYTDGKKAAGRDIKLSDIAAALVDVKGIGTKKTAEVMRAISGLYER